MEQKNTKIYTKTGDNGTTGLLGGTRVKKYNLRLEAYGTVDELNAALGIVRSFDLPENIRNLLTEIQEKLFHIGSRLASDEKGAAFTAGLVVKEENIALLERSIDAMEKQLPVLNHFILPGGDPAAAHCHLARTVCRRAERRIIEYSEANDVEPETLRFMNRLSDFLFVLSRQITAIRGAEERPWRQSEK